MPDILSAATTGTKERKVEWEGLVILMEWTPSRITGTALEEVTSQQSAGAVARLLEQVVVAWDVTAAGEPVPTTAEGFMSVPVDLMRAIFTSLNQETTPSGEASGSFAAT